MSKNQSRGRLSSMVLILGAAKGVEGRVPAKAASRLKGRAEVETWLRHKVGGSMRVNGADTCLFLASASPRLNFVGERPAGAVRGARGEDMFALRLRRGVSWRRPGKADRGDIDESDDAGEDGGDDALDRENDGIDINL